MGALVAGPPAMIQMRLGGATVHIGAERTVTTLPDGSEVYADHAEQPGQAALAADLGYPSAEAMNRDHDMAHSLLASWLGLPCSPTLQGVASGKFYKHHRLEEAAVLAIQRFARAAGIDLTRI